MTGISFSIYCFGIAREAARERDVFSLDESGFSSRSCWALCWAGQDETLRLPADVPGRTNVIGFLNRDNEIRAVTLGCLPLRETQWDNTTVGSLTGGNEAEAIFNMASGTETAV